MTERVPEDVDENWAPVGYTPGPDDPGPVTKNNTHGDQHTSEPFEEV